MCRAGLQPVLRCDLGLWFAAHLAYRHKPRRLVKNALFQWNFDNARETRFRPRILSVSKSKPHAIAALEPGPAVRRDRLPSSLRRSVESHVRDNLGIDVDAMGGELAEAGNYAHPYEAEIRSLSRAAWQFARPHGGAGSRKYAPLQDSPCTWVDTAEAMRAMLLQLEAPEVTELAVDLEHHHYRSFQGFLCLMQISTRDADFLVDTIAVRDELYVLNSFFTDPARVKVLHGADRDILWLQRDLGLYVVNMFDTGQAARVLEYPMKSLAYLLKTHCGVTAQKQYQLADWRVRPLPDALAKYAREDTHYLL